MARWCPRCRAEYVEGWGVCSTCGVELVDELPPEESWAGGEAMSEEPASPRTGKRISFLEPGGGRSHEDPFVPIWEGPTLEANALARRLEGAFIPVDLGEAASSGWSRIEVPRSYVPEAEGLLDEATNIAPYDFPLDDEAEEIDILANRSHGLSLGARFTILIVAAMLVITLLLARAL